jgi:hypothetical protein
MEIEKFNKTETVLRHIDNQIIRMISEGKSIDSIIIELQLKITKFETTIETCNKTEARYRYLYTHNKVCMKRILDLMYAKTLKSNYDEYSIYPNSKIFGLIKLRDKIVPEKFIVELPQ